MDQSQKLLHAKPAQQSLQGKFIKWCSFLRLDLAWKTILAMPKSLLSFCLGATFDTLPSPSNLYRCHSQPSCYLCSKAVCTTAHILGACKVVVQQGRFTYHHDSVLQAFLSALETSLSSYSVSESLQHHRNFVIPGPKIIKSMKKPHTGLLYLAPDWRVMSDSNNKLDIQSSIVIS